MKKQILVVDDEVSMLTLLNFTLSQDYDIVLKQNGADAMSWLEDGNYPALIISDLEMPYIDGAAFIRNLKSSNSYSGTPVILLSGTENLETLMDQMPYGADYFLRKPFDPVELKSCITRSLDVLELTKPGAVT